MASANLLRCAQRMQAIAQAGIAYSTNPYDLERYEELRGLSVDLLSEISDEPYEKLARLFTSETGYQTPKVDVRAVIFNDARQVLLVREKLDQGRWTLPGGWADVGYSPFETAVKEAREESGLEVRPLRLLALLDRQKHAHPPNAWYIYKAFIRCEVTGGAIAEETSETSGAGWFSEKDVDALELSVDRVTPAQYTMMFRLADNPDLPALCD